MNKILFAMVCSGCAVAGVDSEDSTIDTALTGDVTLQEVSVPSAVLTAMEHDLTGDSPSVRHFHVNAPSSTSVDDRVRGAVEGLFYRTRKGGSYAVKKYCAKLPLPETEPSGCASAILSGAAQAGDFDEYLDDWGGEVPAALTEVRNYLAATLGTVDHEHALHVDVGHEEDGEWWVDWRAHRAILFDAAASELVVMRYATYSSP